MDKPINRQSTTPFLLKLFYRNTNGYAPLSEFPIPSPSNPAPALPFHLQIYTWQSCSLRELAHLLTTSLPDILPSPSIGTRLSFRLVYPDTRPPPRHIPLDEVKARYISREMGSVTITPEGGENIEGRLNGGDGMKTQISGEDSERTLGECRFVVGDWVDVAVFPPGERTNGYGSSVKGSYGIRENGYGSRGRGRGGFGGGRGDFGGNLPSGEWRRGERPPDGGYRGGGGGSYGRGRGRPGY